eukprot:COSAG04_NODE_57_length_30587_cov_86.784632_22_plen_93_part_00
MLPLQNAMAAVREGGGSVLHINPHLLWAPRDTPFQSHDGSAMNFYETHIEVRGPTLPLAPSLFELLLVSLSFAILPRQIRQIPHTFPQKRIC